MAPHKTGGKNNATEQSKNTQKMNDNKIATAKREAHTSTKMGGKITQTNPKILKLNDNYNVPQNAEPTPQPKWEVCNTACYIQNYNKH